MNWKSIPIPMLLLAAFVILFSCEKNALPKDQPARLLMTTGSGTDSIPCRERSSCKLTTMLKPSGDTIVSVVRNNGIATYLRIEFTMSPQRYNVRYSGDSLFLIALNMTDTMMKMRLDSCGRPVSGTASFYPYSISSGSQPYSFEYDQYGRLATFRKPLATNPAHFFTYDSLGNVLAMTPQDPYSAFKEEFTYDYTQTIPGRYMFHTYDWSDWVFEALKALDHLDLKPANPILTFRHTGTYPSIQRNYSNYTFDSEGRVSGYWGLTLSWGACDTTDVN
ncbi:hypothetical protein ACWKWU_18680 [Chitinophaga lutea]